MDQVIFKVDGNIVEASDKVDHQANIELSCPTDTHTPVGEASRKCEDSNIVEELSGENSFVCYESKSLSLKTIFLNTFVFLLV